MRSPIWFVMPLVYMVAAGTLVERQTLVEIAGQLPSCATDCLLTLIPSSACSLDDQACVCTNQDLATSVKACLLQSCTVKEQLTTKRLQSQACKIPTRSISYLVTALTAVFLSLATFAVVARIVSRLLDLGGGLGVDDWAIVVVLVLDIPSSAFVFLMADGGLGKDAWMITFDQITQTSQYFLFAEIFYTWVVGGTKVAILLFYLRVFPDQHFRYLCQLVIAACIGYCVSCTIGLIVGCSPVSFAWTFWDGEHHGRCINRTAMVIAMAACNIGLDLVVFVLPIPALITLNMKMRKRLSLCLIFLVGLFVTICSSIRLKVIASSSRVNDPTWSYASVAIWSVVETDVGIFCACMPSMAAVLRRMWPGFFGTTLEGSRSRAPYGSTESQQKDFARKITQSVTVSVSHKPRNESSDEVGLVDIPRNSHPHLGLHAL